MPNKSSRFSIRSTVDGNAVDAKHAIVPPPENNQARSVIAPPTRPTKSKVIAANRTILRCCTVRVQRLSASGTASPTAKSATSANTASCSNAADSVSEGMVFMTANDTTSSTANAAAGFPLRTLRTSSAHTPPPRSRHFSRFARRFPAQACKHVPSSQAPSVSDGKKAGAFRHRPDTCSYSRAQPAVPYRPRAFFRAETRRRLTGIFSSTPLSVSSRVPPATGSISSTMDRFTR